MKVGSFAVLTALVASTAARSLSPSRLHSFQRRQLDNSTTNCTSYTPIPPKQDPWYAAPAGFEKYSPGTVFKIRNACGIVSSVKNSSAAYQILYRTTDSQYNASFAVTTLIFPSTSITTSTGKLVSYHFPYDTADLDGSPSYTLYSGGGVFGTGDISNLLQSGYVVVAPDYEGPKASFVAGVTSGHAVLDGIRAVFACPEFGIYKNSTKYAMWGYSGGALAGEWAAELQVQYAPELTFAGAALGGLTPNVTSVLLTIDGTLFAGLAVSGILGLASQYPDAQEYLEDHLNVDGPYNKTRFNAAYNYTLASSVGAYANQNITDYFDNGFNALLSPVSQKILARDGQMGYHGVPTIPLLIYKAIGDQVSPVADTDKLVAEYCNLDATINYQRNTQGDHLSEGASGEPAALGFLASVLAGTYNETGCQIMNVTN